MGGKPGLEGLLDFDPERGLIRLKDYRMVMLSAAALGALRKELVETLGPERARGVMKRFGHASGLADALALRERFPGASPERSMNLGPALHALEGVARIVRIQEGTEIDLSRGRYRVEAYWDNSYEAEQHLAALGPAEEPACWTLAGYATGHSSVATGRPTLAVEHECRAMGHERCRFSVRLVDDLSEEERREERDYEPECLPDLLRELYQTTRRQEATLRSKERAITRLESELQREDDEILGSSAGMRRALELVKLAAPVGATVLILGESGTGKELLARAIHRRSPRESGPFVAVNCSALPENLQEAELFGFARGAFTGAVGASVGLFESAGGGTLFLDEIGDLAPSAQTKILRALQEGEIKRLGENRVRKVDLRIVAATHRDLRALANQGGFREDLFYRLSVMTIEVPPLRERGDDALILAEHYLRVYAEKFDKPLLHLSRDAKCALAAYPWPGNVRELENAVQRAVILAAAETVELYDLPEHVVTGRAPRSPARTRISESGPHGFLAEIDDEADRIRRALEMTAGKRDRAATLLGISRTTLWRRMREHGVDD